MKPSGKSRAPFVTNTIDSFADVRFSLPELLAEVKMDRASTSFAMEKLDQPAITKLFEQHRSRRASKSRK
jgi:hypothetical protein